jgi:hypothetical protein
MFFFEKKNQKNFSPYANHPERAQGRKSLFASFYSEKEESLREPPMALEPARPPLTFCDGAFS